MPRGSVKWLINMTTEAHKSKPIKRSVALLITNQGDLSRVLLVLRPDNDDEFPGMWGLPAASLKPGETLQATVRRIGVQKLGVDLVLGPELGYGSQERTDYVLEMVLIRAMPELHTGEFSVKKGTGEGETQYDDWRWGNPQELEAGAQNGSLCSELLLDWIKAK